MVIGLDISLSQLSYAKRKGTTLAGLVCADAQRLPFADASFDAVVYRSGLHHLLSIETGVKEAKRILRKGGIIVMFEPCDDSWMIKMMRRMVYLFFNAFDDKTERGLLSKEVKDCLERNRIELVSLRRRPSICLDCPFFFKQANRKGLFPIIHKGGIKLRFPIIYALRNRPLHCAFDSCDRNASRVTVDSRVNQKHTAGRYGAGVKSNAILLVTQDGADALDLE